MDKHKKDKKQGVKYLFILITILISSCTSTRKNIELNIENIPVKDCAKYTFQYSDDKKNPNDVDSVIIYGNVRICATDKIAPFAQITVKEENTLKKIDYKTDEKGRYYLKLKSGYYTISVFTSGGHLDIPLTYFGDYGNKLELDMYLRSHPVHIHEMNDKKLRKEVEELKEKTTQRK